MTRFIGEAVGQRSGRGKGTSAADLRKEMEGQPHNRTLVWLAPLPRCLLCCADFQKTGRHRELEQAAAAERVPALPERDQNRPHIFMDLRQNNKTIGTYHLSSSQLTQDTCLLITGAKYGISIHLSACLQQVRQPAQPGAESAVYI